MKKYLSYFVTATFLVSVFISSCDKEKNEDPVIDTPHENKKDELPVLSSTVSLDNTSWQNGKVIIPNTSEISILDFDRLGDIVAVGYTIIGNEGKTHLTLAKINSDEFPDKNFENCWLTKVTNYENGYPLGLKITKDNKIVVIGSFAKVQFQGWETIVMRFNQDGTVDDLFGDNGKVNLNFNAGSIISVNIDNEDFMLIAKYNNPNENRLFNILKYNYDGQIDKSFGKSGEVLLTNSIVPYCMKVLNDGSILVAGTYNTWPNTELGFCKLTPKGELDKQFANNGIWHMNVRQDFDLDHEYFSNIFEDKNGSFILSGLGNRAFLSKFSSKGKLDTSFGKNGFYYFDFMNSNMPVFQVGDKYVTAGWYNNSHKIISVNNSGSFGEYIYNCEMYYFQDMKLQGRNRIILGGGAYFLNGSFAFERVIID